MENKRTFFIESSNQCNKINCVVWIPDEKPKAILQISHGMMEHIERYQEFATFLNSNGILVVGSDHLGHGGSVNSPDELGYFGHHHADKHLVDDLFQVTKIIKESYPDIPYFIFGHSMGSYLVRRYLMEYGNEIDGAIMEGSGNQPHLLTGIGLLMVKLMKRFKKDTYRSRFVTKMIFGGYTKRIKNAKSSAAWLTSDVEILQKFRSDTRCGFIFTLNGYETLFQSIRYVTKMSNIRKIPKDTPILIISGSEDPVGGYGKDVKKAYYNMKKAGIQKVDLKLYQGLRHETLNEVSRNQVYQDILSWIHTLLILEPNSFEG